LDYLALGCQSFAFDEDCAMNRVMSTHSHSFALTSVTFPMTFCAPTGACKKSKMTDKKAYTRTIHIQISCPTSPSQLTNGAAPRPCQRVRQRDQSQNQKPNSSNARFKLNEKKQWELIFLICTKSKKRKNSSSYQCTAKLIQRALNELGIFW